MCTGVVLCDASRHVAVLHRQRLLVQLRPSGAADALADDYAHMLQLYSEQLAVRKELYLELRSQAVPLAGQPERALCACIT
jgi:hypothetical protein